MNEKDMSEAICQWLLKLNWINKNNGNFYPNFSAIESGYVISNRSYSSPYNYCITVKGLTQLLQDMGVVVRKNLKPVKMVKVIDDYPKLKKKE